MASLNRGRMSAMTDDNERAMQMLVKLKNDINSIDAALPALKEECTLFQRNMYKNYSQHRRAAFYKHLQEVSGHCCHYAYGYSKDDNYVL